MTVCESNASPRSWRHEEYLEVINGKKAFKLALYSFIMSASTIPSEPFDSLQKLL